MGLRGRLVPGSVGGAILAVALVAAVDSFALRTEFERYSRQQQDERTAAVVASLASAYERAGGWSGAQLEPAHQLAAAAGATLAVYDPAGGTVLAASATPAMDAETGPMSDAMRRMMGGSFPPTGPERSEPIQVGGRTVGTATLTFPANDLPAERDVRDALATAQWIAAAVAALAALAFALVFARRIARPVAALAGATAALRRGERGARVRDLPDDELGDLGRAFNAMAGSIEREEELRRAVVADLAHELRTPLTSIQGHLEALRDGVIPPEPATFATLHDEASRLGRLVADLEALARAEGAGFALERRRMDLADVARDVAAELADRFRDKGVRLDLELAPASAFADPDRTAQVVRNLVSNALKFTPARGRVRVVTRAAERQAVVEVSDTGVGMSRDEAAHAFDRFWRAPSAAGVPGSGIGLTIARELAAAHDGSVAVESEPGRGSTFRVSLPSVPPK